MRLFSGIIHFSNTLRCREALGGGEHLVVKYIKTNFLNGHVSISTFLEQLSSLYSFPRRSLIIIHRVTPVFLRTCFYSTSRQTSHSLFVLPTKQTPVSEPGGEGVVANLITNVFNLHIRLCYFAKEDFVYPPASDNTKTLPHYATLRHAFPPETDEAFAALQLSRRAIAILERTLYLRPNVDNREYSVYGQGCKTGITCRQELL